MSQTPLLVRIPGELRELLPRFLDSRRGELVQLRAAVAGGDLDTARRIGHVLKGVGGGYGFDEITRLGGEIERRATRGQDIGALVEALGAYLDTVEVTFD
jgi:HPt (histidine-containing phosphotransfer) domain-containing protein